MTTSQFKRWLAKQACTFEKGRGGHQIVRRNGYRSALPMHGSRKDLGKGLVESIKKDPGLK